MAPPSVQRPAIIGAAGKRSSLLRYAFLASLCLVLLTAVACGGGSSDSTSANGTPTASPVPADASAIRGVDIAADPATTTEIQRLGSGSVNANEIVYADLTGDGRDEAVVPISSSGTLGNIAYLVFTLDKGKTKVILTRTLDRSTPSGLKMDVENGQLVETVGEYGPDNPLCCPSVLRKTYFQWNGSELSVEREERQQQPPGPKD